MQSTFLPCILHVIPISLIWSPWYLNIWGRVQIMIYWQNTDLPFHCNHMFYCCFTLFDFWIEKFWKTESSWGRHDRCCQEMHWFHSKIDVCCHYWTWNVHTECSHRYSNNHEVSNCDNKYVYGVAIFFVASRNKLIWLL